MSETKPIKRSEHIVQLSRDHHFTLLFCWKIRNGLKFGVETTRMSNYVAYFWQRLMHPHFNEEETILFSPVNDAKVQRALDEHAGIAARIQDLQTTTDIPAAQLANLADAVESHVRYEERELFPHLEKVLTEAQLENIGKQIATTHDATVKDEYADEFWMKDKNGL